MVAHQKIEMNGIIDKICHVVVVFSWLDHFEENEVVTTSQRTNWKFILNKQLLYICGK